MYVFKRDWDKTFDPSNLWYSIILNPIHNHDDDKVAHNDSINDDDQFGVSCILAALDCAKSCVASEGKCHQGDACCTPRVA